MRNVKTGGQIDDEQRRREAFSKKVQSSELRKLKARHTQDHKIWFGLGVFGVIGWSVAIPALFGLGLGLWVDARWPSQMSWTLMLLLIGTILGCLNAWYWISRERQIIDEEDTTNQHEH